MATPGSSFTPTPLGHEDNLEVRHHPLANTLQVSSLTVGASVSSAFSVICGGPWWIRVQATQWTVDNDVSGAVKDALAFILSSCSALALFGSCHFDAYTCRCSTTFAASINRRIASKPYAKPLFVQPASFNPT
ncbi:hypothetical protein TNCV_4019301 [Trichonephila clavipes]|nr:hypothetical protein TNCV_4019301 [Trichonephila clavipes]